jgi:hypothetical protein
MEISGVSITMEDPILAAPLPPEGLLTPIDLHKGGLKGVPLEPLISGQTSQICSFIKNLDLIKDGLFLLAKCRP